MSGGPSPRESLNNWRTYEGSFSEKLRLSVRNQLIKLRTGRSCCGNHGEPGC